MELNPTVTSDQHTWALHWQRGIDGYQQFYASANRSKAPPEMEDKYGPPPDSWELTQRTFGGHYTVNWSNPSVQREYLRTINFWVEAGVDGFYMKHLENMHVLDPADIRTVVSQWRQELHRFRLWSSNRQRVLITSVKFAERLRQTADDAGDVLQLFDLVDVPLIFDSNYGEELSTTVATVMDSWWKSLPNAPWVMWHFGSADSFRFANRVDAKYREALMYCVLMLPESVSVFYGDEIGLVDSFDIYTGNVYRGGQFAPMPWTPENLTSGFTGNSSEPWLPLPASSGSVCAGRHLLQRFTRFTNIHNVHSWNRKYRSSCTSEELFVLERPDSEEFQLLVHANLGHVPLTRNFSKPFREVNVLASTPDLAEVRWNARSYTLRPGEAFVAEVHV